MSWFFLGLSSGLFFALSGVVSKRALKDTNPYLVAFAHAAFALPFLLVSLFWLKLVPLNVIFWQVTLVSAVLNVVALILMMHALKVGELSLTLPFLSFTPLFLIFTSSVILGEFPSTFGMLGILVIVAGAYVIGLSEEKGIGGPIRALAKNKGAQLMLAVAFIYAVSSNFDKIAVLNSSPVTYTIIANLIIASALIPFIYLRSPQKLGAIPSKLKPLLLIGFLTALMLLAQMAAFNLGLVSYVISLKRTSALWSVALGFLIFKERHIKTRLLGALIMVVGVLLISQG